MGDPTKTNDDFSGAAAPPERAVAGIMPGRGCRQDLAGAAAAQDSDRQEMLARLRSMLGDDI